MIILTSDKFIEVLNRFDSEITQMEEHVRNQNDQDEQEEVDIIPKAILQTIKAERVEFEQQFKNYNDST